MRAVPKVKGDEGGGHCVTVEKMPGSLTCGETLIAGG